MLSVILILQYKLCDIALFTVLVIIFTMSFIDKITTQIILSLVPIIVIISSFKIVTKKVYVIIYQKQITTIRVHHGNVWKLCSNTSQCAKNIQRSIKFDTREEIMNHVSCLQNLCRYYWKNKTTEIENYTFSTHVDLGTNWIRHFYI